jgi:hypothetical protein
MMPPVENLSVGELPEDVINAAVCALADYSIGFLRLESTPRGPDAVLLGSGTLVSLGSKRAVLTAHHVLSVLPRTGRLGLVISTTLQHHTVDTQGLTYLEIARGTKDADGPDLGAVVLAPSIAGAIAAKKTFYNLDLRQDQMLHSPPDVHDGFWLVNGFVDENTVVEPASDGYSLVKGFYNVSGTGGPEEPIVAGDHDYFTFLVGYRERSVAPRSFGGMSGGGLWQVPLVRDARGRIEDTTPLLSGVVFYQVPTSDSCCGVKCHGRQSVYRVAYQAISDDGPLVSVSMSR